MRIMKYGKVNFFSILDFLNIEEKENNGTNDIKVKQSMENVGYDNFKAIKTIDTNENKWICIGLTFCLMFIF